MSYKFSGILSPFSNFYKNDINFKDIINISYRKRLFSIVNNDCPYSLDIEIKNPINDIKCFYSGCFIETSLPFCVNRHNFTKIISFRYRSIEECEKEIRKFNKVLEKL